MSKRKSNPGYGKAFTFHGSFVSLILARRREKEIPGSFIHQHKGRYYVLKPKKIRSSNPRKKRSCYVIPNRKRTKHNPSQVLIYGRVLKIFAQKTSGPYKGERFVHEFKPGALMYGMPDGSLKIIHK